MTLRLLACGRTGRRTAIPARTVETPRTSSVNLFKRHTTSAWLSRCADGAAVPGRRNGGPAPRRPSPRLAGGSPVSLTSHHRRHGRPGSAWFPRDLWNGPARGALPSRHTPARRGGRRGSARRSRRPVESPGVRPTGAAAMTSYSEFAEPRAGGRRPAGATDACGISGGGRRIGSMRALGPRTNADERNLRRSVLTHTLTLRFGGLSP